MQRTKRGCRERIEDAEDEERMARTKRMQRNTERKQRSKKDAKDDERIPKDMTQRTTGGRRGLSEDAEGEEKMQRMKRGCRG